MPKPITHISVFLASPSDLEAERSIAFELIHEWNDLHTDSKSAVLQIKSWKTSSYPELGKRPQAAINEQVLDDCDIVVGMFWTRFGSPTGIADSGTEEEIRRSVAKGKPVLLYFSDVPASLGKVDQKQYQKVIKFRDEFRNTGLIWNYASHDQFRDFFRRHLERAVQKVLTSFRSDRIAPPTAPMNVEKNDGIVAGTINQLVYKTTAKRRPQPPRATGTIGSDMLRKNYVGYLVREYNAFQKRGREEYGDKRMVSFSFLSTRVIQVFGAPAKDLPLSRFEEVVEFIKEYLDDSIVGRNNRSSGIKSYKSFEEYSHDQLTKRNNKKK